MVWRSHFAAAPEGQSASALGQALQRRAAVRELERQRPASAQERQRPASALVRQREVRASARERQRQVRAASLFRAPAVWAHPARRDELGS